MSILSKRPLKAIVLDNDSATGSYNLLFDFWEFLQSSPIGKIVSLTDVLSFWLEIGSDKYMIFRPHFFDFLAKAISLRDNGKIDAIIMYTHQNADFQWKNTSIPAFLSILMGLHIKNQNKNIFDKILSLPPNKYRKELKGGFIQKSFERILNLYPWKPRDIRDILFVDDKAHPSFIEANNVESNKKHTTSWQHVPEYNVAYSKKDFIHCIEDFKEYISKKYSINSSINDDIINHNIINDIGNNVEEIKEDSLKNKQDNTFIRLSELISIKFQ